ncbi:MAG: AAA-like domain-containing protein [Cyanobacteria bacterium P01_D01_bin.116]
MTANSSNFYQVGASLPVNAPSYVQRQADEEFYQKLQAGKFCYVLNSRQMGKSSLRVQTMQRLQKQGTVCAAIDLTGIGKVTEEQWYGGIVYNLSESCQLEDKFNFDWRVWWQKHQTILSPVQCLNQFIEKVLLAKIQQPIVIFVDEIDKVLSQDFSLDDFFALIRFFQNQRVDNPIFERLTFALLGVATPGDLITNKTQTPFNIGEAIELHGFKIDEVEPLIDGLQGRFDSPKKVMAEILYWTGGQPFLTQKLCKFMVEESAALQNSKVDEDYSVVVREVVNKRIIENWESQDNPEHLRTIRDRILSSEQRAGYLLELYQQIQQRGEVTTNNSVESSELRLSGLVVQRQGKLRVYNQVYQQVFNRNWVETQLKNLRPYSEAFRAWVASGYSDESRLLQGKALESAEKWAKDKNLSFQDKQFLAASKEKEIAVRNQEAELERERKDREAAEKRNQVLSEANVKAKRRIRNGTVVLVLALFGAISLGGLAAIEANKAFIAQKNADDANQKAIKANQNFETAKTKAEGERKKVLILQQKAFEVEKKFKDIEQKAQQATKKAETEQRKAEQAERNANTVNLQAKQARKQAQKAQQDADNASRKAVEAGKQTKAEQRKAEQAERKANVANLRAIEAVKKAETEQRKAEQAKKIATDANRKAQEAKQEAESLQKEFASTKKDIETVQELSKLAGELSNENLTVASDEALRQAGLSFRVNDHNLKQAMLLAAMSQAYRNLAQKYEREEQFDKNIEFQKLAEDKINESLDYLNNKGNKIFSVKFGLQIKVLVKANEGKLFANTSKQQAINAYTEAYNTLKNHPKETNSFEKNQVLTTEDIESVHRVLLTESKRNQEVWNSLKEHFYARLENSLKSKDWRVADLTTDRLILFIADREEQRVLNIPQIETFSCAELKKMDNLWVNNSNGNFGFSVQKEIWVKTGNRLGIKPSDWNNSDLENYLRFASAVGWYNDENEKRGFWVRSDDYIKTVRDDPSSPKYRGGLPINNDSRFGVISLERVEIYDVEITEDRPRRETLWGEREYQRGNAGVLVARVATCKL